MLARTATRSQYQIRERQGLKEICTAMECRRGWCSAPYIRMGGRNLLGTLVVMFGHAVRSSRVGQARWELPKPKQDGHTMSLSGLSPRQRLLLLAAMPPPRLFQWWFTTTYPYLCLLGYIEAWSSLGRVWISGVYSATLVRTGG